MSFQTVILEAAKARAERDIEATAAQARRGQELIDLARQADEQAAAMNWKPWLNYLREHVDQDRDLIAARLSLRIGRGISGDQVRAAIRIHKIEGRKRSG
jgi:predicted NBD/HSP70 family sugar kinase